MYDIFNVILNASTSQELHYEHLHRTCTKTYYTIANGTYSDFNISVCLHYLRCGHVHRSSLGNFLQTYKPAHVHVHVHQSLLKERVRVVITYGSTHREKYKQSQVTCNSEQYATVRVLIVFLFHTVQVHNHECV